MSPVDWPPLCEDDLDVLRLEVPDRERIAAAIAEQCRAEDLLPADPRDLPRYGRFVQGEEDPAIRRFLVAPPGPQWTTVLLSAPDWEHDWVPRLTARLRCRAAYVMLHDGDVMTLHLHSAEGLVASHVTSHVHFDRPDEPRSPALPRALEAFGGRPLEAGEIDEMLAPPGRIDVDGRLAFLRVAKFLGVPDDELGAYRFALREDALLPRAELSDWVQLAFSLEEGEASEAIEQAEEAGRVVPFGKQE